MIELPNGSSRKVAHNSKKSSLQNSGRNKQAKKSSNSSALVFCAIDNNIDKLAQKKNVEILLCAFLGAAIFLIIYGFVPLNVTRDDWIFNGYVEEDIKQSYAGQLFLWNSSWSWPLGLATSMAQPGGSVISFLDSIPICSIAVKLFYPILPKTFQLFGWYVLACFILQGISSGLLVRLFTKNKLATMLSAILFILSPIMLERAFRHNALASHWLVLFALFLYFLSRKKGYSYQWQYMALLDLAVGIHPYFVPMVFGILVANAVELGIKKRKIVKPILFVSLNLMSVFIVGYAIGLIGTTGSGEGDGVQ